MKLFKYIASPTIVLGSITILILIGATIWCAFTVKPIMLLTLSGIGFLLKEMRGSVRNGKKEYSDCVRYYKHDLIHREDGPAYISELGKERWFLDNCEYSENDFYQELFKRGIITEQECFLKCV